MLCLSGLRSLTLLWISCPFQTSAGKSHHWDDLSCCWRVSGIPYPLLHYLKCLFSVSHWAGGGTNSEGAGESCVGLLWEFLLLVISSNNASPDSWVTRLSLLPPSGSTLFPCICISQALSSDFSCSLSTDLAFPAAVGCCSPHLLSSS